ncbi:MAG: TlpA family protein disulfide reductase [Betaproteobacteria bacterium]|nr:TlpA family protein disulfide reductase [Betaproteobacteria bacterium]
MNKSRRRTSLLIGGGVLAAAGGLVTLSRDSSNDASSVDSLWKWPLQNLEGSMQPLHHWRGKVLVVNFWATWCEPCRVETPILVKTQHKYAAKGVEIVGIAIDSAAKVQEFAREYKVQYPLLIAGLEIIEMTKGLGNKAAGLPYTVVLDRSGKVQARHLGGISEHQLELAIIPLL